MTYGNGLAPDSALVAVDGLHTVPGIAPRVLDFMAFARTQGRILRIAHPYGSYRSFAEQGKITGTGNSSSTVPAAAPGYSTHGVYDVGRVDFVGADGYTYTSELLSWIVQNAPSFGLSREFGDRDPNHFVQSGAYTPKVQEIDMAGWQFLTPDTVVMPNGYATSLPHSAWVALKARQDNPDSSGMDWATGWYTDLSWQSVRFIEGETAKATADAVKAVFQSVGLTVTADTTAIVQGVLAGLPKPPTEFTITGKADAS